MHSCLHWAGTMLLALHAACNVLPVICCLNCAACVALLALCSSTAWLALCIRLGPDLCERGPGASNWFSSRPSIRVQAPFVSAQVSILLPDRPTLLAQSETSSGFATARHTTLSIPASFSLSTCRISQLVDAKYDACHRKVAYHVQPACLRS